MENQSLNDEQKLQQRLSEWKVETTLPPRFREQVWHRIARMESRQSARPWQQISDWFGQALMRPRLAFSYVAMLLLAGLLTGYWQGRATEARTLENLSQRYVQLLDPYQNPQR